MRDVATSRARPVPASQAEKASSIMGAVASVEVCSVEKIIVNVVNRASIMPSMHRSAETRCVRCRESPMMVSINVIESRNCIVGM